MSWSVTSIKAIEYLFKLKKKTQPKDEFVDLFFFNYCTHNDMTMYGPNVPVIVSLFLLFSTVGFRAEFHGIL